MQAKSSGVGSGTNIALAVIVLGTGGLIAGCANTLNRFTVNSTAPVLKAGVSAIDTESDVQFAREAAPASLKTVETFLVTTPENPDLLEVLASGYTQYVFGFLEDDLEAMQNQSDEAHQKLSDRATAFYDRALDYALRLASLDDKRIVEAMKGGADPLDKLIKTGGFKGASAAPGLYWTGLALLSGINLNRTDMDRIADLPKAVALLERAHTLAPAYGNHGAAMALGVVYASQGRAMGGDPARSKKMFDEVIQATGGKYHMAKVLYARFYATVAQDRALFESTLHEVLETPAQVMPAQRLANEIAHIKAARYLAQADDLFLPPEPADAAAGTKK